jgi:hypothetical protein
VRRFIPLWAPFVILCRPYKTLPNTGVTGQQNCQTASLE